MSHNFSLIKGVEKPPNIRHLAALAATVRHGSLTRAARAVNLTQPALTQAIGGLERSLQATLFDRGPWGMRPTPAALLLASRAEAAVEHIGSPRVTGTQVRAFLAVARGGSYLAAAEATGLSSASLHRAIADLSQALGQRLIDRRGKGVVLSSAGLRRARAFGLALAELRSGLEEVAALQGKGGGRIAIGAMPLSRARWLPEAIAAFVRESPNADIAVHEGSHAELAAPLRDGEIDLMLGALRPDDEVSDLVQESVFEDYPVIVMRTGHPLLHDAAPASPMLNFPWLVSGRGTPLRMHWETMLRAMGHEPPHVSIECGSVMLLRQLLLASDALTLLARDQVSVELEAGVLAALAPPVPVVRTIGISTRAGWRPTRMQSRFIEILKAQKRSSNDSS